MFAKTVFAALIKQYLTSNPQVVERLAAAVLHGLIEHISPSGLTGEASASPLAELKQLVRDQSQVIPR